MKNFILTIIAILFTVTGFAQVYVGNSFIYSKGTNLYAKGNINLTTNGKIYLRGEAQLIQGDDTANTGDGILSVFQEGTATNFDYNYWSAPVSQVSGSGNQGFLNSQIYFPTLQDGFDETGFNNTVLPADLSTNFVIDANQAIIQGLAILDGKADRQEYNTGTSSTDINQDLEIAGRWLYSYRNGGGYSGWTPFNGSSDVVAAGYGFSMKGVTSINSTEEVNQITGFGQRYDFRGRPNNGTIQVSVNANDYALVGNPYPSALDLKQFLIDANYDATAPAGQELTNSEIDNEILFWEQQATTHFLIQYEGGYGKYTPGSPTNPADNGMYAPATFTRYDSQGNPTVTVGGPPGPVGGITRRYAPIGQGFMISRAVQTDDPLTTTIVEPTFTAGSVGTVNFTNSQRAFFREDGDLSLFKAAPGNGNNSPQNANPVYIRPKLRLNVKIDDTYVRQLVLAFGNDSTDGLDWGLEGKIDGMKQPTDVYMPQFSKQYVIKTIPFAINKTIPLGIESAANNSTFEFQIGEFENFDTPNVFIHDKYNNTYHDIKNRAFVTSIDAGTIEDRFEIVFEDPTTLSNDQVALEDQFDIIQNNNRKELSILNPDGLEVSNIALYDMGGKEIISSVENSTNSAFTFPTASYSTGIYIVRVLTTDNQEVAIKVSIDN